MTRLGRWRIVKELGRGGYGSVGLGEDDKGQRAAVKVFGALPEADRNRHAEASVLQTLAACPTVPALLDEGREPDGRQWLAMEYVPGHAVGRDERLSVEEARKLVCDVGYALECAHDASIVHGDVKPANVVTDGQKYVLVDWGIAARYGFQAAQAQALGTPGFAAPERLAPDRFGPFDGRADVYSLASLYWAAVTGRSPFQRPDDVSVGRILRRQLDDDRPGVEELRGYLGSDAAAVWEALAANPAERPATIRAFLGRLKSSCDWTRAEGEPGLQVDYNLTPAFRVAARALALFPAANGRQWREHFETASLAFDPRHEATPETRLPELFSDPLAAILATWLAEAQQTPAKAASALTDYARRAAGVGDVAQGALSLGLGPPPSPLELRRATLGAVAEVGGADPAEVARVGIARWLAGKR